MLRDEANRLVGSARDNVVVLPIGAPLRDIEKAWIHVCERQDSLRRAQMVDQNWGLSLRILGALDRCLEDRRLNTAHLAVLAINGQRGQPPNTACEIAYRLWTEAMAALEAEANLTGADQ